MANNDALFNAALSGLVGGSQNRWLTSLNTADYDPFRLDIVLIATAIDDLIPTIDNGPTVADIQLMQSICQGVFEARLVNVETNFSNIAGAIVALWTNTKQGFIAPAPIDLEGNGGASFQQPILFDDFVSGSAPIAGLGAGTVLRGGLGDTNWLGVFTNTGSGGQVWGVSSTAADDNTIGLGQLSTGSGTTNTAVSAICRGYSATDTTQLHVRDIFQLDWIFRIASQDAINDTQFAFCGINANWASLSQIMGLERLSANAGLNPTWKIRRSGEATLDTGVISSGNKIWYARFQQKQDLSPPAGELGLGTGFWDLYLTSAPEFNFDVPVVENYAGGAAAGDPLAATNYGFQVANLGQQSTVQLDSFKFTPFRRTLTQRLEN